MQFLSFEKYTELGGKLTDDSTFTILEQRARRKVNAVTFDRLVTATTIPDEVQELMVQLIDIYNTSDYSKQDGKVNSYSNGVESFSYDSITSEEVNKNISSLIIEYLGNTGLLYRGGAKFDYI